MASYSEYIAASGDDQWSDASNWFNGVQLDIADEKAADNDILLNFDLTGIEQGATISAAVLKLTSNSTISKSFNFRQKIEDVDSPTALGSGNPTTWSWWGTTVTWTVPGGGLVAGTQYTLTDITPLVQHLVDRGSWPNGGGINTMLEHDGTGSDGDEYFFRSWDYGSGDANTPLLEITYTNPSAGTVTRVFSQPILAQLVNGGLVG